MATRKRKNWSHWVTDRSPIVLAAGALAVIFGLITAIPGTWATIMTPLHSMVDGRVDIKVGPLQFAFESTSTAVRDLQIEAAEGKLSANRDAYVKWEVELRKTKDPVSRELIQKQMQNLEATRGKLEEQLGTLRQIRRKM